MTLLERIGRHPIGLGTAPLGSQREGPLWWGPQDHDRSVATIHAAIDAGVAFIDTAPFYGWGAAEAVTGDALASIDDHPPILTKCGIVEQADGSPSEDASRDSIRRDVQRSLERLGLDRIDVVQVHEPDPATPIEATWEALMELVAEGVIGGAGLSNHPVDLMERVLAVGPIAAVQQQYSALSQRARNDGTISWCVDHGIPFLAWGPLASGFLVDDFDLDALDPDDLRRRLPWATNRADRTHIVRVELERAAAGLGTDMIGAALSFATATPGVAAIVGARSPDEGADLRRPISALDPDSIAALEVAGV